MKGYYPRMVSDEEWARLRTAVETRNRMKGRIRGMGAKVHSLFQGLVRCAECGGPISYQAPVKRARAGHPGYLHCPAARRGVGRCSNRGSVEYGDAESHMLTRLSMVE